MLLRRISQHVKDQNWFAVGLDFFIVVIGVFIGIQVANWNAERLERVQERDYLLRLYDDFGESINGQTRDLGFLKRQLSDYALILESIDACNTKLSDMPAFQRGINTLGYINPPRIFRRTVDEMVAAGRTDIISNAALKELLSQVIAQVEWRGKATESVARSAENNRFIIEEYVRYDLTRKYPDPYIGEFIGVDFDIKLLCQSPKIARAISAVSYITYERYRAYEPILEQYRKLQEVIAIELRSRWQIELELADENTN